ncbi:MAG: hypothetical protein JWM98_1570 [Thermoleophilia bacterium]|nr:hypothetical protein [Thermoleophilia bacterium]
MPKRRRTIPLTIVTALLALSFASSASAAVTTVCVGFAAPAADCTTSYTTAQLQTALTSVVSDGDADTVRLAAGLYLVPGGVSMTTNDADRVEGAGQDQTILRNTTGDTTNTLVLDGSLATPIVVSDLTVERSAGTGGASAVTALETFADHVTARGVYATGANGVTLRGEHLVLQRSVVETSGDNTRAVYTSSGGMTIEDSRIVPLSATSGTGLEVSGTAGSTLLVRRSFIGDPTGVGAFIWSFRTDAGNIAIEDSVTDLGTRANAYGVYAMNFNSGPTPIGLTVHRSTFVGTGTNQTGVLAGSDDPGEALTFAIDGSVVKLAGTSTDIGCYLAGGGTLAAPFTVSYTAYNSPSASSGAIACTPSGGNDIDTGAVLASALFRDPATHDFHPRLAGVLIDAGDPAAAGLVSDASGAARLRDGDGAGTPAAVVDLGGLEYQRAAPVVTAAALPLTGIAGATTVAFSGTASDLVDNEAAAITGWTFGDGGTAASATASHVYAAAGTFTATATATDASGVTGTAAVQVVIAAASVVVTPVVVTPPPAGDTVKPVLTVLGPLGALPFLRTGKVFATTTSTNKRAVRLTVSEASNVELVLARKVGRRFVTYRGHQSFALAKGAKRITWTGRWQRSLVPVGTYRVTLVATDAAGNHGAARSVVVKLVAPRKHG